MPCCPFGRTARSRCRASLAHVMLTHLWRVFVCWQDGAFPLSSIATSSICPVDLNSFMFRFEKNMARLHDLLHRRHTAPHAHAVRWSQGSHPSTHRGFRPCGP
jgi:hypothetical protein